MRLETTLLVAALSAGLAGGLRADSRVEKTLKLSPEGDSFWTPTTEASS